MRKVAAISDLDALMFSGSGRELVQREALANVGIMREVVRDNILFSNDLPKRKLKQAISKFDSSIELGVSASELQKYFIGNANILTKRLKQLVGIVPNHTAMSATNVIINNENFRAELRRHGPRLIWAFKKDDTAHLARVLNLEVRSKNELKEVANYDSHIEFGATQGGLKKYFIGNSEQLARKLSYMIGADPNKADKPVLDFKIGGEIFCVELRSNVNTRIWVFHNDDISRLALALNLELRPKNRPVGVDNYNRNIEFGASALELGKYFVGTPKKLAIKLKMLIGENPNKTEKISINLKIRNERFRAVLRKNGASYIWAFDKVDIARIADVMNWKLKTTNKPSEVVALDINTEFGASSPELKRYFFKYIDLALVLKQLIGEDPDKSDKSRLEFKISEETFTIHLRTHGPRRVWAFDRSDKLRLAHALNWEIKTPNVPTNIMNINSNTEFGAGSIELQKYFVGTGAKLTGKLKELIPEDPNKTDKTSLEIKLGDEIFKVSLRKNLSMRSWVFSKADIYRLADALNWEVRPENRPTEIPEIQHEIEFGTSSKELKKYFLGNARKLAIKLNQSVGEDPYKTTQSKRSIKIENETFEVLLKKSSYNPFWTFKKVDLARLAKAMNWQLKPQKRPNSGLSRLVKRMTLGLRIQNGAATGEV